MDSVIVTVAPMFIGEGIGVVPEVSVVYVKEQMLMGAGGWEGFAGLADRSYGANGEGCCDGLHRRAEKMIMFGGKPLLGIRRNRMTKEMIGRKLVMMLGSVGGGGGGAARSDAMTDR